MDSGPEIKVFDLVQCLAQAVDLVSPQVADHHRRVAYIAWGLANEMGLPISEQKELAMAGAMHDVGGLSCKDRLDALQFEFDDPYGHSLTGYLLLKTFSTFANIAHLVRYHHIPWRGGAGAQFNGQPVPLGSHLLHLADRISVLIDASRDVIPQVEAIRLRILEQCNSMFHPQLVEAFLSLAEKEYFWFDCISPLVFTDLDHALPLEKVSLNDQDFLELTSLFSRIMDFRSPYTAFHSAGVATNAEILARLSGFSEQECRQMRAAGFLHDLGKLAVPAEVLEKPARLSKDEYGVVRGHAYYTNRILESVHGLEKIRIWGAYHHERMDGSGYPFHLQGEDIPQGSRIMAVADVFVALNEHRPYRNSLQLDEILQRLQRQAQEGKLDGEIVNLLARNHTELVDHRISAQAQVLSEYRTFALEANHSLAAYPPEIFV